MFLSLVSLFALLNMCIILAVLPFPTPPHLILWKCETEYIHGGEYFQRTSNVWWKAFYICSQKVSLLLLTNMCIILAVGVWFYSSFIPFPSSTHLIFWKCETEYIQWMSFMLGNIFKCFVIKAFCKFSYNRLNLHFNSFKWLKCQLWQL